MVRVISMLQMVLLVLLLKESDAVNWECSELQNTISGLETNISSITEEKHKKEQFFGQCEVSIYICVYVYIYVYIYYIYIIYIYISSHARWNDNSNNSRSEIQDRTSCPTLLCRLLLRYHEFTSI